MHITILPFNIETLERFLHFRPALISSLLIDFSAKGRKILLAFSHADSRDHKKAVYVCTVVAPSVYRLF